jgi:hypothetical protein
MDISKICMIVATAERANELKAWLAVAKQIQRWVVSKMTVLKTESKTDSSAKMVLNSWKSNATALQLNIEAAKSSLEQKESDAQELGNLIDRLRSLIIRDWLPLLVSEADPAHKGFMPPEEFAELGKYHWT